MLECYLNKSEGKLIIKENGEEIFISNLIINYRVARLDDIEFSNKKIEELSALKTLQSSISFLKSVENAIVKSCNEMGLNVESVTFGKFAEIKRLDATIAKCSEETTPSSKR